MRDISLQQGCYFPSLPHSLSRMAFSFGCNFGPWNWPRNVVLSTGTSLSFCQSYQELPKVVLRTQHNLDSLSLNTLYAVEEKVNPDPLLMTKPLVPYKEMFWSSSWLDILTAILMEYQGSLPSFFRETEPKKIETSEIMDKEFLLSYTEDETIK